VLSPTVPPALQITPGLVLQFDTHPCGQYQVMRSLDRVQWEPFGPPIAGDGDTATVQLASTLDESWMFRIEMTQETESR
jgi:hypothetical protein